MITSKKPAVKLERVQMVFNPTVSKTPTRASKETPKPRTITPKKAIRLLQAHLFSGVSIPTDMKQITPLLKAQNKVSEELERLRDGRPPSDATFLNNLLGKLVKADDEKESK